MFQQLKTQQLNGHLWLILVTILVFASPIIKLFLANDFAFELSIHDPFIKLVITILGVWFAAILMNNICNRKQFLYEKSNLPAALTLLLGSQLVAYSYSELIGFILMIIIINKMIKSYSKSYPIVNYFDVGMLIGILSLMHLPNTILLFALWFSIPILSDVKLKDFLLTIISFSFVWLFYGTYLFITDQMISLFTNFIILTDNFFKFELHHLSTAHYIYFGLGIISTLYSISKKRYLSGVQGPVLFTSIVFLLVCFLMSAMFLNYNYETIVLGVVPLIILSSYYFYNVNKNLANILFYIVLSATIILQWVFPLQHI